MKSTGVPIPGRADEPPPHRKHPRRWLILGSGGAGKSTFARELGALLQLPTIYLDRCFWKPGWEQPSADEFDRTVRALVQGDAWVMDGNYSRTLHLRLPRAQAAVLLDPPTLQCIWGVTQRSLFRRWKSRPDLPEGCREQIPDLQFLRYVATYKWRSRPGVLTKVRAAPHVRFYHLKTRRKAAAFLADLSRCQRR